MKITLNIETDEPADLHRIVSALAGEPVAVTVTKPAARTTGKSNEAPTSANAAIAATSAHASATAATMQSTDTGPSANVASPTDADMIAAANAAVAKLGVSGPATVKKYIAEKFPQPDGSPGTLLKISAERRPALIAALQSISRGELVP